jgi:hypothetical protein
MSHAIRYLDYHCSTSEAAILKDLNRFAYDPQESSGYHGNLKFQREPVYKDRAEAMEAITRLDKGWYDDWAVRYRQGRKIYYLVKVEWHC